MVVIKLFLLCYWLIEGPGERNIETVLAKIKICLVFGRFITSGISNGGTSTLFLPERLGFPLYPEIFYIITQWSCAAHQDHFGSCRYRTPDLCPRSPGAQPISHHISQNKTSAEIVIQSTIDPIFFSFPPKHACCLNS